MNTTLPNTYIRITFTEIKQLIIEKSMKVILMNNLVLFVPCFFALSNHPQLLTPKCEF